MTKKRKFKRKEPARLQASNIEGYIKLKYEVENDQFWGWLFEECSVGDVLELDLNLDLLGEVPIEHLEYFKILKQDFNINADEDDFLEIENDNTFNFHQGEV